MGHKLHERENEEGTERWSLSLAPGNGLNFGKDVRIRGCAAAEIKFKQMARKVTRCWCRPLSQINASNPKPTEDSSYRVANLLLQVLVWGHWSELRSGKIIQFNFLARGKDGSLDWNKIIDLTLSNKTRNRRICRFEIKLSSITYLPLKLATLYCENHSLWLDRNAVQCLSVCSYVCACVCVWDSNRHNKTHLNKTTKCKRNIFQFAIQSFTS